MDIKIIYDPNLEDIAIAGEDTIWINPDAVKGLNLESILLHERAHIEMSIDLRKLKDVLKKFGFEIFDSYWFFGVEYRGKTILLLEREGWWFRLKIPKKEPRIKKPKNLTLKSLLYWIAVDFFQIYCTNSSGEIFAEYYAAALMFDETLNNRIKIMISDDFFKLNGEGQRYHMRYLMGIYLALNYGALFLEKPEAAFEYLIYDIDNLYIFLREILTHVYNTIKSVKKNKRLFRRIWDKIKTI